ncbi:MAG: hypothetical protein ACI94Y_000325 [Maribacter sp.]|jgi:hypothetical protein
MKSILFIILITNLFILEEPISKVTWDKTEHDFGIVEQKEPVFATFVFTNVTEDSIKLDNVRTSCGCTSPIWNNKYVMSGDTSHIVVEYDANDRGEFAKEIKVFINKQRKAEKLYVYGDVME